MAAYSVATAKHATLSTTTVDTVTITAGASQVEVINRDTADYLYITYGVDPTDPTAAGDDTIVVPPGNAVTIDANGRTNFKVKIIGDGGGYSVQRVDQ